MSKKKSSGEELLKWETTKWGLVLHHVCYFGVPVFSLRGKHVDVSAEVNRKFPFGCELNVKLGARGVSLDLNSAFGAPNRIYVWGLQRRWVIGLLDWHVFLATRRATGASTRWVVDGFYKRSWPRLVRSQEWDWQKNEWSQEFKWLVTVPNDYRERWAATHPEEAAAAEERQRKWEQKIAQAKQEKRKRRKIQDDSV